MIQIYPEIYICFLLPDGERANQTINDSKSLSRFMNEINQIAIDRSEECVFALVSSDRETLDLDDFTQEELDREWPEIWHSLEEGLRVLRQTTELIEGKTAKKTRLEFTNRVIERIAESLNAADQNAKFHLAFKD